MPDTVVVFAGGPKPSRSALAAVPPGAPVIAADAGAEHALAHGLRVEAAVGDFDSLSVAALAALERNVDRIERHAAAKDATDLELALDVALTFDPRRVLVVGGVGGRLDHLIGELSLLASDSYAHVELDAVLGRASVHVVRRERSLSGRRGALVSLLALHGPAVGVRTEGLVYPLRGETLPAGSTRGISNVFAAEEARISLRRGVLLAIKPYSGRAGNGSS